MLANVSVAFAEPLFSGLKATPKETLLPSAIVTGSDKPVRIKLELLELAEVTVTSPPEAARVPVAVPLVPTVTLPKLSVDGATANCNCNGLAAIPVSGIASVVSEAFEVIATLPLALPVVLGLNITVNLAVCPAAKFSGRLRPLTLKPAPVTGACVTVTLDVPVLVSVSVCDWLAPVCTLAKFTLAGATVRFPAAAVCVVVLLLLGVLEPSPWQPIITLKASVQASVARRVRYRLGVAFMRKLLGNT